MRPLSTLFTLGTFIIGSPIKKVYEYYTQILILLQFYSGWKKSINKKAYSCHKTSILSLGHDVFGSVILLNSIMMRPFLPQNLLLSMGDPRTTEFGYVLGEHLIKVKFFCIQVNFFRRQAKCLIEFGQHLVRGSVVLASCPRISYRRIYCRPISKQI